MSRNPIGPSVGWTPRSQRLSVWLVGTFVLLFAIHAHAVRPAGQPGVDWGDPKGKECVECHMTENPGLYWEWNHSQHGQNGVTCLDCHQAEEGDIDAWRHEEEYVSIVITPKDCSKCHEKAFEEMDGSHHAKGGQILGSLDNLLGEVVGGPAAVNAAASSATAASSSSSPRAAARTVAGRSPAPGPTLVSVASIRMAASAPAPPATAGTASARRRRARRTPAASAMSAPTIRRSRSTTSPSTASSTAPRSMR